MDMIYWDHYYNAIIVANLAIVIALFATLRFSSGAISHVRASHELFTKDNPAFGISLAGAMAGITIMLSGTIYGSPENDILHSIVSVGVFGALGIFLMALTRIIFDKLTLPAVNLREQIISGNIAVALADAGNVIATAIILRAVMIWVEVTSVEGIIALFLGFGVAQLLLTSLTILKRKAFDIANKGNIVQDGLNSGNIAIGLRFAGIKIGSAFAIATAAKVVVYEVFGLSVILGGWFIAALMAILAWKILTLIAEKLIFFKVDVSKEIVEQKNTALGATQAVIYIAMGILIYSL